MEVAKEICNFLTPRICFCSFFGVCSSKNNSVSTTYKKKNHFAHQWTFQYTYNWARCSISIVGILDFTWSQWGSNPRQTPSTHTNLYKSVFLPTEICDLGCLLVSHLDTIGTISSPRHVFRSLIQQGSMVLTNNPKSFGTPTLRYIHFAVSVIYATWIVSKATTWCITLRCRDSGIQCNVWAEREFRV